MAPVRSSKQDQIHASLVSTLLALMDGMDGRGESNLLIALLLGLSLYVERSAMSCYQSSQPELRSSRSNIMCSTLANTAPGQVIVIGATNRPDAVDPALRRPGRFDREFYFPLPNKDARKKIIEINTKEWDPPLSAEMVEKLGGMTKGYGGADLRVRTIYDEYDGGRLMRIGIVYRGGYQCYPKTISTDLQDYG